MINVFLSSKNDQKGQLIAGYITDCHYETRHLSSVKETIYCKAGCCVSLRCTYYKRLNWKA